MFTPVPVEATPLSTFIEKGETVNLLKRRTDWVKIEDHRGIKGWIRYEDLAHFIDPAGNHLSFALPDFDSYLDRNFELGVAIGDFNGAESLTLILGYKFSKNLTTEIRLEQATGQFSDNKLAHLNITHQPFPEWRISPYFLLGAGYIETSPSATLVETEDRRRKHYAGRHRRLLLLDESVCTPRGVQQSLFINQSRRK